MLALSQVSASSAAAHAGIISGDILIKIDGNKVIDTQHNGIVKELLGRWRFFINNIATERIATTLCTTMHTATQTLQHYITTLNITALYYNSKHCNTILQL